MKDDRLFRVIVLSGIALAGISASVAACGSSNNTDNIPHPEGPPPPLPEPSLTASMGLPPEPPHEGPPPPEPLVTATALPSASAIPTAPPPHREGPPPPHHEGHPPPLPPHHEGPPPPLPTP